MAREMNLIPCRKVFEIAQKISIILSYATNRIKALLSNLSKLEEKEVMGGVTFFDTTNFLLSQIPDVATMIHRSYTAGNHKKSPPG